MEGTRPGQDEGQRGRRRRHFRRRRSSRLLLILRGLSILLLVHYWLARWTLYDNRRRLTAGGSDRRRRALILTAHPDDEVMFFAPAILTLTQLNVEVYGLCLSNGNADGWGVQRAHELKASYDHLGVDSSHVRLIDDPQLRDGMQQQWDAQAVLHHVDRMVEQVGQFDLLLTFDRGGVSGHANHVACAEAVEQMVVPSKRANVPVLTDEGRAYALTTMAIPFKFAGLPGALVRQMLGMVWPSSHGLAFLSSPQQYWQALYAMSHHRSQLVWFRYLYVLFSNYMFGGHYHEIAAAQ